MAKLVDLFKREGVKNENEEFLAPTLKWMKTTRKKCGITASRNHKSQAKKQTRLPRDTHA
jgi:hypothetical protein